MNLSKEILKGQELRNKLVQGIDQLADTVKVTLGPKGRNVIIEKGYGVPHVTKDGVSSAKECFFSDKYENLGAQMVKQVAIKTAEQAGDGTTTATVLAQSMIKQGMKLVSNGTNPVRIKKGMEEACSKIVEKIKEKSKKIETSSELEAVATISSNGDLELGSQIAQAMEKIGDYGVVTVGESQNGSTTFEVVPGMTFDQGLISPYLINDYQKMETRYEDCLLLLVHEKISSFECIAPIIEYVAVQEKRPLVIIAEDFIGNTLPSVIANAHPNPKSGYPGLDLCVVKAPGYGNRRIQILEDIAALTGATVISKDKGFDINSTTKESLEDIISCLGTVGKIQIKQFETSLFNGGGSTEDIEDRINYIKNQMNSTISEYDKETYKERLSKLTGGMAIIKVGGNSDIEIKEKKDRVDDAIAATKSAKEEGIVSGGGTTFYNISEELISLDKLGNYEEQLGYGLVLLAIQEPIKQILRNGGIENIEKILVQINEEKGYDAYNDVFTNMMDSGIIDPAKVLRCAIENATSVASLILTTDAAIVGAPEEKGCNCQK